MAAQSYLTNLLPLYCCSAEIGAAVSVLRSVLRFLSVYIVLFQSRTIDGTVLSKPFGLLLFRYGSMVLDNQLHCISLIVSI